LLFHIIGGTLLGTQNGDTTSVVDYPDSSIVTGTLQDPQ
jgi:hypothetical protein